jgi:hypothetical protein
MLNMRRWLSFAILLTILAGTLTACGESAASTTNHDLSMAPMSAMPDKVKAAPAVTQQAYQFAVANPDVMKQIPCYCGCGGMGHTSNYMCYVSGVDANGKVTFDSHALGCSICVDITQDVMRMMRQGKSVSDMRAYVDQTYSRYGQSNMK